MYNTHRTTIVMQHKLLTDLHRATDGRRPPVQYHFVTTRAKYAQKQTGELSAAAVPTKRAKTRQSRHIHTVTDTAQTQNKSLMACKSRAKMLPP